MVGRVTAPDPGAKLTFSSLTLVLTSGRGMACESLSKLCQIYALPCQNRRILLFGDIRVCDSPAGFEAAH